MGRRKRGGEPKAVFPYNGTKTQPLCTHGSTERSTVYLSGQDDPWQQFHTKCSLINASQWHRTLHSGPS